MITTLAVFSSPIVDGEGPLVSDTTALVFIAGGIKMPLGLCGLDQRILSDSLGSGFGGTFRLLYVAAELESGAGEGNDAVKACLYFGRQIPSCHQAFRLPANRIQRLHEVSLLQFAGIVGHEWLGQEV